jgi:hypothetical protein
MDAPTSRAEAPRRGRDILMRRRSNAPTLVDTDAPTADDADMDWRSLGIFGAGLAVGALLGAGVALLVAPASGFETRTRIVHGARRARERAVGSASDQWEAIGDRVRRSAKRGRRSLARKITLSRWRAEDAFDRRPLGGLPE